MNDPHIQRLRYRVRTPELVSFQQVPSATWSTREGVLVVDGDRVTIELINHYATEDEARAAVQPLLESWEIWAGLTGGYDPGPFFFTFTGAEIVDRATPSDRCGIDHDGAPRAHNQQVLSVHEAAVISVQLPAFPALPQSFAASPMVQRMWYRWQQYLAGHEPLPHVAFYCLTELEREGGGSSRAGRAAAGAIFGIDPTLLGKLGDLVSEVGSPAEARKAHRKHWRAYTEDERSWMHALVKAIIQRVGEVEANPVGPFALIDQRTLPKL